MVSNRRSRRRGPRKLKVAGRKGEEIPADVIAAHTVEVGQNERIGEKDRIVEKGLGRHQA
jgi:hypothetical protein